MTKDTQKCTSQSTLADWLAYWLENYVRPVSKPSGYEHYADNCNKHIIPVIGNIPLGNISPAVLQRFFNEQARMGNLLTGGPLSTKSLRNMRAVLDVALKMATALEYIPANPVPLTAIKAVKSRRVAILTNESQQELETYLFMHFDFMDVGVLMALYTGMRLGEICALRWRNYDSNTGMLHIEFTVKRLPSHSTDPLAPKTELHFGDVKTSSSERSLYMPPVLKQILTQQKARQMRCFGRAITPDDFIVSSSCGTVMDPDNLSHHFKHVLEKLGLSHIKFHALRHTFATRTIESGIDVATVSGLLGHADVTTTTHFYVHPREEAMRRAMSSIAPIVGNLAVKGG